MTDVVVDTLRMRGAAARRLARVAATTLPRALERALTGVGDVRLDRLTVRLDVDLDGCDDETLALLWADAVRAEVLASARPASPLRPVSGSDPARADESGTGGGRRQVGAAPGDVAAAALEWLASASGGPRRVPSAVLALAEPGLAAAVREQLGPTAWTVLCRALTAALAPARRVGGSGSVDSVPDAGSEQTDAAGAPESAAARDSTDATASPLAPVESAPGAPTPAAATPPPGASADLPPVLATLVPLVADRVEGLDPGAVTRAAGLVLLYPWLADHCRRAESLHPHLDPLDVREAALGLVVAADDPDLADDPLVGLLAGRPPHRQDASRPVPGSGPGPGPVARHRNPLPRADAVLASAEGVLAAFAAVVPGFARSSPAFVRDAWVARLGVLDLDRDPVQLTAATHPLDVVLSLLPHPVGLVKLPWSPPVTVRFR